MVSREAVETAQIIILLLGDTSLKRGANEKTLRPFYCLLTSIGLNALNLL
jgi:hypothetical protein